MYCFYEQTNVHKRWFYCLYLNRFSDSHSVIEYRVTFSVSIVIFRTNNSSLQGSLLWLLSNFSWEWEKSKNNVTNWPMAIADVKCHCIDFIRSHNSIKKLDWYGYYNLISSSDDFGVYHIIIKKWNVEVYQIFLHP